MARILTILSCLIESLLVLSFIVYCPNLVFEVENGIPKQISKGHIKCILCFEIILCFVVFKFSVVINVG